jgi:single-stranded-DNA-specific exonuclease
VGKGIVEQLVLCAAAEMDSVKYHATMTDKLASQRARTAPRQWVDPPEVSDLSERLHHHPLLHRLLALRGLRTAAEAAAFLNSSPADLPDPFHLVDMELAVERITRAIVDAERIAIYGDYDVDGITSAAIMQLGLRRVVDDPSLIMVRLPTRAEGYGLNPQSIDELAATGVTLLIAADCGSTDAQNVAYAVSRGIEVVIIDHHHMACDGPEDAITISPARPGSGTYRETSAAGLCLLVMVGLETSQPLRARGIAGVSSQLVDLAALGIVADVSPMLGVNRNIVRDGLRLMRTSPRIGIRALCDSAGIDWRSLNTTYIGFNIAPRLNAAGRMRDPQQALDLLLTNDPLRAGDIASQLEVLNYERRRETEIIVNTVLNRQEDDQSSVDTLVLVESGFEWKTGILGLAAGKLVEQLGRPVILLSEQDGVASGSARSVDGYNVIQALHRHADILDRFGGHSQAAGLSLAAANIGALRAGLNEDAADSGVALPIDPQIAIDADIDLGDLTLETARLIIGLSPFGAGNPEPVFRLRNVRISRTESMGKDGSHLRMVLRGPAGEIRAPFFGAAYRAGEIRSSPTVDLLCTLSISHWNGPRLDVMVKDFRGASLP